jgi:hypothetical protein
MCWWTIRPERIILLVVSASVHVWNIQSLNNVFLLKDEVLLTVGYTIFPPFDSYS